MSEKIKLILDCDPGHDDAVAIIMAARNPAIELLGLTTVRGNQLLDKTTRNALNVCQYLDIDVPVCRGAAQALVRESPEGQENVHGTTGLDGPVFPPLTRKEDERGAVSFIIEQVKKYPHEVTLAVTGPMTNVALALRMAPEISGLIRQIVFMGGSWGYGNISPSAEFNIWADAEAAYVVFHSGIPLVMMGLDVTRKVLCYPQIITRMEKIGNKASGLFADMMRFFCRTQKEVFGWEGGPLHDPTTIAWLLDQSVVTLKDMYGDIDITGGPSHGRTNVNVFLNSSDFKEVYTPNIRVGVDIDAEKFWNIIETCLHYYDG